MYVNARFDAEEMAVRTRKARHGTTERIGPHRIGCMLTRAGIVRWVLDDRWTVPIESIQALMNRYRER
jgi:hypothetical protein